jgi:hypothetical protein
MREVCSIKNPVGKSFQRGASALWALATWLMMDADASKNEGFF